MPQLLLRLGSSTACASVWQQQARLDVITICAMCHVLCLMLCCIISGLLETLLAVLYYAALYHNLNVCCMLFVLQHLWFA
jgi:hypothetical protein